MITNLLVANRGEIASRVFSTCRRLGIGTVAVHSDADAGARHTAEADTAVRLPGDTPVDTYLRADRVVAAALAAGADAVHPGYGFLSENPDFARAVLTAGLIWVGPAPESMAVMASKTESKRVAGAAGVPVLAELDPDTVPDAGLPVVVKASAGGGGRGMRVVTDRAALPGAVVSASAEAASAFGDPAVFCERYVERGRHVEVQILADAYGTVWALGERDCSVQRRHQKLVEESPAPGVDPDLRRLSEAACAVSRAVDYVGAGTVEFLLTPDGEFFFLEMNTRLQVEHPVTECVTGLDLVEWQLRVAEGRALTGEPPPSRGHAVEARLYAEDPAADWRPESGTLHRFALHDVRSEFGVPEVHGIRLDSGVADGTRVSVHYDSLLAKVIAWAPERQTATRMLASALASARVHGLVTNRELLVAVLRHPAFLRGDADTGFLARHPELVRARCAPATAGLCAVAAALADAADDRARARVSGFAPPAWRNVPSAPRSRAYRDGDEEHSVRYTGTRSGYRLHDRTDVEIVTVTPERVVLDHDGVRLAFDVARYPGLVVVDSPRGSVSLVPVPRFTDPREPVAEGSLVAPMPGTVTRLAVSVGARVRAGEALLWLEAMKMEHPVSAPAAGVVSELPAGPGQAVEPGTVLAVVTPGEETAPGGETAKESA